jgi:cation diffusion facilitator family transporter
MTDKTPVNTIQMQKILVTVSVLLFVLKMIAWYLTGSVAILTDALESTVNVVAGFIGLYSIILSAKPRDKEHPYGHGKIEFLSSAIEGVLIAVAGLVIIYKAIEGLLHPQELKQLDSGVFLLAITAVVNYIVGYLCVRKGRKEHSPILIASGSHLKSDTWSTLGILVGIILILFTGLKWIDSVAAFVFAIVIIYTGYKIVRRAVSGIMDESDSEIVTEIVSVLNKNRLDLWIDVHNMRVINYAGFYHIDCHLTVPYYINVNEAHQIMDSLTDVLRGHFRDRVEFFVHVDGCVFQQCGICSVGDCPVRKHAFVGHMPWTNDNILSNAKHVYIA